MATNSQDNPAPIDKIDTFNPEEWSNSTKTTSGVLQLASLSAQNIFTKTNTFSPFPIYINGNIIVTNKYYINSKSSYIDNTNFTISIPLSPIYIVSLTNNLTITLPTPDSSFENCSIWFRRIGSLNWALYNSFNVKSKDNNLTNVLLDSGALPNSSVMLTCFYDNNSTSYIWSRVFLL